MEVGSVESVLAATVVEIERNQGRIANPGPKVKFYTMLWTFVLTFEEKFDWCRTKISRPHECRTFLNDEGDDQSGM